MSKRPLFYLFLSKEELFASKIIKSEYIINLIKSVPTTEIWLTYEPCGDDLFIIKGLYPSYISFNSIIGVPYLNYEKETFNDNVTYNNIHEGKIEDLERIGVLIVVNGKDVMEINENNVPKMNTLTKLLKELTMKYPEIKDTFWYYDFKQYADIEEEIEIDLDILCKMLKNGAYFKNPYRNEIIYINDLKYAIDLTRKGFDIRMSNFVKFNEYSTGGFFFKFEDYGVTLALTREELENGNRNL